MEAADGSGNKPTTAEAVPPSATDRPANATAASNVMSSLAGLGSSSSEDEKQKEMDVGGTVASSQKKQPSTEGDASMNSAAAVAPATSSNDSSKVKNSADGGDAMEVDQPTAPSAAAPSASIAAFGLNVPKSQPLPSSPSKPQQSAKMKARGIISTLEASADSAFASKPAALPSAATMGTTGDGKKKRKEKDDKKKAVKKKGKDKVKKKKVRLLLYFRVATAVGYHCLCNRYLENHSLIPKVYSCNSATGKGQKFTRFQNKTSRQETPNVRNSLHPHILHWILRPTSGSQRHDAPSTRRRSIFRIGECR